jgi:hypothetical protein
MNMLPILPDKDRLMMIILLVSGMVTDIMVMEYQFRLLSYPPNMSFRVSTIGFSVSLTGVAVVALVISV